MMHIFKALIEKGRKFSKANEGKLRKALESISELLAQLDTAAEVTEAERSFNDRHKALNRALRAAMPEQYPYVADVFDDDLVYEQGGRYWRCSYTLDDAGNATFGDAVEVIPQVVYNAVGSPALTEAAIEGDCVPLTEVNLAEASATLKLIAPGWGSSGYYPESTLRAAAGVFGKGLKMFWNHQTSAEEASRPEGDLDKLAAELTEDAQYLANGSKGPGLYAKAKVFERYTGPVKDLAEHIGVSIRASGMAKQGEAEGRKGPIIERIAAAKSVDFVTIPGAGGEIVSLFESAGRRLPATTKPQQENEMNEEQIKALVAAQVGPLQEAIAATKTEAAELRTENARLREAMVLQSASEFVRAKLATIDMPEVTRRRLAESLPSRATIKDGRLDEAAFTAIIESEARNEVTYLQSISGGRIVGMGASSVTEPKAEDVDKSLMESLRSLGGLDEKAAQRAAAGRMAAV
jgi:hypothetical protein